MHAPLDSTVNAVLYLLSYLSASIASVHGVLGLLLWSVKEETTGPRWSRRAKARETVLDRTPDQVQCQPSPQRSP